MAIDQILTIVIISTLISYFSYFFWNKNIDKLIQKKLTLLKDDMIKNGDAINRKLKRIELHIQRNKGKEDNFIIQSKKGVNKNDNRDS
jgi:hypothetical protein